MEKGLTTAYKVAKNFLDFALIPIKAMFDTLSNLAPIKAITGLFGVAGEGGIDLVDAQNQMAQFEKLGEVVGTVVGALLGFKVVGTLSSIVTKPFKGLFDILTKTRGASDELRDSMDGVTGNGTNSRRGLFSRVGGAIQGFRDRRARAGEHFNSYLQERSELPETTASSYAGYGRVNYTNAPKNLRDFSLKDGANPYDLYTRQPKGTIGRLSQALFGAIIS